MLRSRDYPPVTRREGKGYIAQSDICRETWNKIKSTSDSLLWLAHHIKAPSVTYHCDSDGTLSFPLPYALLDSVTDTNDAGCSFIHTGSAALLPIGGPQPVPLR